MPKLTKRLTDAVARSVAPPPSGYEIHWCAATPGFGVRVTSAGARAYIGERRVEGRTVRRTLGKAAGAAAISSDAARRLQLDISSELQQGKDRLEERRESRAAEQRESVTLKSALEDYVKHKRRAKDGLPLKERTRSDYLAMVEPGGTTKAGRPLLDGPLYSLAQKSIHRLSSTDIRELYRALEPRGERQRTYALQVLRALLRHNGIVIEGNPLSPSTAGAQRVVLAPSRGRPSPIPAEKLGAWWKAACAVGSTSAHQLRFQLLTGCRPGEVAGITVGNVDSSTWRVTLKDTKNRQDHVILLSTQARDILKPHLEGKKAKELVFGVEDAGKTLRAINEAAGVDQKITAHKLRHTFASIGASLLPVYTLKRLLNHAAGGDITDAAYVHVGDAQLRAGWQAVADAISNARGIT